MMMIMIFFSCLKPIISFLCVILDSLSQVLFFCLLLSLFKLFCWVYDFLLAWDFCFFHFSLIFDMHFLLLALYISVSVESILSFLSFHILIAFLSFLFCWPNLTSEPYVVSLFKAVWEYTLQPQGKHVDLNKVWILKWVYFRRVSVY